MYVCMYVCTGSSKSFCAPDDYNTESRCTETFLSPCIFVSHYVRIQKSTNNNFNLEGCLPVRLLAAKLLKCKRQPVFLVRLQANCAIYVCN